MKGNFLEEVGVGVGGTEPLKCEIFWGVGVQGGTDRKIK